MVGCGGGRGGGCNHMVLVYWTTHTNPTHPHGGVGGGVVRGWSPPCCRLVGGGADDGVAGGGEGRGRGGANNNCETHV